MTVRGGHALPDHSIVNHHLSQLSVVIQLSGLIKFKANILESKIGTGCILVSNFGPTYIYVQRFLSGGYFTLSQLQKF